MLKQTSMVLVMDPYYKKGRVNCTFEVIDTADQCDMRRHKWNMRFDQCNTKGKKSPRRTVIGPVLQDTTTQTFYVNTGTGNAPLKEWMT